MTGGAARPAGGVARGSVVAGGAVVGLGGGGGDGCGGGRRCCSGPWPAHGGEQQRVLRNVGVRALWPISTKNWPQLSVVRLPVTEAKMTRPSWLSASTETS